MDEKIYVTKSLLPKYEDYIEEIKSLWESNILTNMGAKHQLLEEKLGDYLKVSQLELVVNGHIALELALQSLGDGVPLSGEVITSPFTFASTTHAIVKSGLTPVFCDINPVDFTMDSTKIEALITERTVAILPIHVYGNVCAVEEIEKIAKKQKLKVIYDAAHGFGVEVKGRGIGTFGDLSCFSLHATKVFNTVEGGCICINQAGYTEKIQAYRNFGMEKGEVEEIGGNGKMHELSAAMGLCNLPLMDEAREKRKVIFERYQEGLASTSVQINPEQTGVTRNFAYFPIVVNPVLCGFRREDILEALEQENIYPRKYFYPLTSQMNCYKGKYRGETPVAEKIAQFVLCLPIYPSLDLAVVDRVCEIISTQSK